MFAERRGEGGSARRRGVLCGAPRPPPPRREDAQTGRGGRAARGGRPGVPTSAPGHRAGRGRGACRRPPFVLAARRRPGRRPGALSSPGGGGRAGVGWRERAWDPQCACPLPGRPALTLRSYCGRSASSLGPSASGKARGARRPRRRPRTQPGRPRRARWGRGLHPPGPPFVFVTLWRRPRGPPELGEAGERRPGGVGLPAVSHGPLPPPRPCRSAASAGLGQRPLWGTAEPVKSPGGMLRDPGSLGEKGGVRREARRRNPALSRAWVSPEGPGVGQGQPLKREGGTSWSWVPLPNSFPRWTNQGSRMGQGLSLLSFLVQARGNWQAS